MQDFFGNKIDPKLIGQIAKYKLPLEVEKIELVVNGGYGTNELARAMDNLAIRLTHSCGSFVVSLNSLTSIDYEETKTPC